MSDHGSFEARLSSLLGDYADRAPVDVDPMEVTRAVAHRRSGLAWPIFDRRPAWLLVGAALVLLVLGAALIAGSNLLPHRAPIGGGGLLLIDQAELAASSGTDGDPQPVSHHLFTFDEASGARVPIVDVMNAQQNVGWLSAIWSPDRRQALLLDVGRGTRGIVEVASHRISPVQLEGQDVAIKVGPQSPWAPGSDRIASIVDSEASGPVVEGEDLWTSQGHILISDLEGREVGRLALPAWPGTVTSRPIWSPDGSSITFVGCLASCDGPNDQSLLLVPVDGSPLRVIALPGQGYDSPAWSPDGSTIAFGSPDGIQTLDYATGRQSRITHGNDHAPTWSRDGRRLAFVRGDIPYLAGPVGPIWAVDVDGGNLRQLTGSTGDGKPDWSPDGTMLVFTRDSSAQQGYGVPDTWIVGADGAAPRLVFRNASADW